MLIPSTTSYSWEPPSLTGASSSQRSPTATRAIRAPSQRKVRMVGLEVIFGGGGGSELGAAGSGPPRLISSLDRPNRASALVRRRDRELGDAARGGLTRKGAGLGRAAARDRALGAGARPLDGGAVVGAGVDDRARGDRAEREGDLLDVGRVGRIGRPDDARGVVAADRARLAHAGRSLRDRVRSGERIGAAAESQGNCRKGNDLGQTEKRCDSHGVVSPWVRSRGFWRPLPRSLQ